MTQLNENNLRRLVSCMSDACSELDGLEFARSFMVDELAGSAGILREMIPEIVSLVNARDKLCRKHFEDTLYQRYWVNKIHRDPKTGWLVPGDVPMKEELFKRHPDNPFANPDDYVDTVMQSAWEGYKLAFELFEI